MASVFLIPLSRERERVKYIQISIFLKNMNYQSIESKTHAQENRCPHGTPLDALCKICTTETKIKSQPAWKDIEALKRQSRGTRSSETSPSCTVEIEGKNYTIEHVELGESKTLLEVQNLLEKTFGKEEIDPLEIMQQAVNGVEFDVPSEVKYKVFAVRDPEGKVVSTVCGGNLDLRDTSDKPTGETMFMVAYAVTDKNVKQGGLAREAYISALMDSVSEAEKNGKKFTMAAGECTYTSEKFWNKLGWKRVYLQTGDAQTYTEARYVQSALDFDEKTGKPTEDAGEAPEHLMVRCFDRQTPSKEKIQSAIRAFYRWCNRWPREAFDNTKAYKRNQAYVDDLEANFKKDLDQAGQIILLDGTSREKAKKKGVSIREYIEADHGTAGKEDF